MANPELRRPRDYWIAALLAFALLSIYLEASSFYPMDDNLLHLHTAERLLSGVTLPDPNVETAENKSSSSGTLLRFDSLTLSPLEVPKLLSWSIVSKDGRTAPVYVQAVDDEIMERLSSGQLSVDPNPRPMTALAAGPTPDTYVSVFMPGSAMTVMPVLWLAKLWYGDRPMDDTRLYEIGKLVSAICVAISAAFLYLLARDHGVMIWPAVALTVVYGLGTCVWTISSQTLWQHGPDELYLMIGMYFLLKRSRTNRIVIFGALAFSAATWVRPTSAIFAMAGLFNLRHRRELFLYVITGAPFALLMLAYNAAMFGSPFTLGESVVSRDAIITTGVDSVWSTPLLEGAMGLLISPGRGLLVYSPFLIFSLVGMIRIWRQREERSFRPWTIAVLVTWLIHFKYYDWWGGWSFGYRPILDTVPALMIFLIPLSRGRWVGRTVPATIFAAFAIWSVVIQYYGATTFDPWAWNGRELYIVRTPGGFEHAYLSEHEASLVAKERSGTIEKEVGNIDVPKYRYRLWSISDSPINFMLKNTLMLKYRRHYQLDQLKQTPSRLAETYVSLAYAELGLNDLSEARHFVDKAREYAPDHPAVQSAAESLQSAERSSQRTGDDS